MKKTVSLLVLTALLGACTATEDIAADPSPPTLQASAEPQLPEDAPKSAEMKSAGNTYKGGCTRVLEQQLSASPTPEGWDKRLIVARTENEAAGLPTGPDVPNPIKMPPPPDISLLLDGALPNGATCQVMFDLLADGTPSNPLTHCTDEAYADTAKDSLLSMRFEPPGKTRKGLITDFTLCTTH